MSNFEIGSVVLLVLTVAGILVVALVRQMSAIGPTPGEPRIEPDKSRRGGEVGSSASPKSSGSVHLWFGGH